MEERNPPNVHPSLPQNNSLLNYVSTNVQEVGNINSSRSLIIRVFPIDRNLRKKSLGLLKSAIAKASISEVSLLLQYLVRSHTMLFNKVCLIDFLKSF